MVGLALRSSIYLSSPPISRIWMNEYLLTVYEWNGGVGLEIIYLLQNMDGLVKMVRRSFIYLSINRIWMEWLSKWRSLIDMDGLAVIVRRASVYPSIHLSIYLYTFYLSLYLPSYIFIYLFIYLQDMDGLVEIVRRSLTSIDGPAMFLYTLQGIGVGPELEK